MWNQLNQIFLISNKNIIVCIEFLIFHSIKVENA